MNIEIPDEIIALFNEMVQGCTKAMKNGDINLAQELSQQMNNLASNQLFKALEKVKREERKHAMPRLVQ